MRVDSASGLTTLRTSLQERTWSRRAAGWDHSCMPGMQKIAAAVMAHAGDLEGLYAVDLGCGSGQLTLGLAERARSVTAVDFSAEMRPGGLIVIGDMMFGLGGDADSRRILAGKISAIARRGPAGWWRIVKNGWKLIVSREECPAPLEMWERMLRDAGFGAIRAERVVAEAAVVTGRAGLGVGAGDDPAGSSPR